MRKITLILALMFITFTLTSCSQKPTQAQNGQQIETEKLELDKEQEEQTPMPTPEPTPPPVSLTFWNYSNWQLAEEGHEQALVEAFKEIFPNVSIEIQTLTRETGAEKLAKAISEGTLPDIIYDTPPHIMSLANEGALASLNDLFTEDYVSQVPKPVLNASKINDGYFLYAAHTAPYLMAFNKEMLEKHGLLNMLNLEGDRRWTVEQYEALLKALKEKGEKGAVFYYKSQVGDQGTRGFLASLFGSSFVNNEITSYTIGNENGVKALEWTKKMVGEGLLLNGDTYDGISATEAFNLGTVSHTIYYNSYMALTTERAENFTPILVPYPSPNEPLLEPIIGGYAVFNNSDPAKIAMAKEFIKFCVTDPVWGSKNAKATGYASAVAKINSESLSEYQALSAQLVKFYAPYYATAKGFSAMRPFWFITLQEVFSGKKPSAEEALVYFQQKANETLK